MIQGKKIEFLSAAYSENDSIFLHKRPTGVCLQETKLAVVNDCVIRSLWGSEPMGFSGASGGILSFWDVSELEVWCPLSFELFLLFRDVL